MAAPGENLLSVEHLTSMDQNTFTKQRELFLKKRGVQLRQHLRELKERERRARQHNRQLLLQFERAQDTLRDMLASNAAMKTIRMEYERYLEENYHRWQQQLQEKTQASQRKRMEDCLKSYLQHRIDPVTTATVDDPPISQDAYLRSPKFDAPRRDPMVESSAYGQDDSSLYPHLESSWLTQPGVLPGFLGAPFQSPLFPPQNLPYSHPLLPQHLTSPLADHQPWARPEAAGRAPPRYSDRCADGTPRRSSGQFHSEEPSASTPPPILEREDEPSTVISKRVRGGGGGRCLSPELDVKPVRLSGGHAESSESGRASSLTSREKKKREKKGRTKASSSESERCGSEKSSSKIVAASCAVALGSETNSSAEEGGTTSRRRTKQGRGLNVGPPPSKKEVEELNRSEDEKADSLSEQAKSPGPDNGSESCGGEEGSDSDVMKSQTRDEETDDEEDHSSEQSDAEERDEEEGKKQTGSGDEKRGNKVKSEADSNVEEDEEESSDDVAPSRNGKELEAEDRVEDKEEDEERSEKLENEDGENRNEDAASSQEEEEKSEGREKTEEEQEGSNQDEDQLGSNEAGDSEDSIISPQENRSKELKNNAEEAAEDEEEERDTQSSNNNSKESSDEEDIENLLAPQEPTDKKENAVESQGKPKAACLDLGIFQVTEHTAKTDHQSDSDEFDHFYD